MQSIGQRSISVVQTAFIKGLMRLETFGFLLYTAIVSLLMSMYTQTTTHLLLSLFRLIVVVV